MTRKAIVLLSGGLDSTTVLAIAKDQGFEPYALSFRYGQRHEIELAAAQRVAEAAGVERHVVCDIDLRVSKILRYGRTRTQVGIDVYNLMNADTVTAFNQTFSPTSTTWLTPNTIVPARYVRFNLDVSF